MKNDFGVRGFQDIDDLVDGIFAATINHVIALSAVTFKVRDLAERVGGILGATISAEELAQMLRMPETVAALEDRCLTVTFGKIVEVTGYRDGVAEFAAITITAGPDYRAELQ